MSSMIPFSQCVARPPSAGKSYPLNEHLLGAKAFLEARYAADAVISKLLGLAGLCHDVAKAYPHWQAYIQGKRAKGPHHAGAGAFMFSYLAYLLLQAMGVWNEYRRHWLWICRDLADHHGLLKELNGDWIRDYRWSQIDLCGFRELVVLHYPELGNVDISNSALSNWIHKVLEIYDEVQGSFGLGYRQVDYQELMQKLQGWRGMTASLIAADRFEISPVVNPVIDSNTHKAHLDLVDAYCARQHTCLSAVRQQAQQQIMRQLEARPTSRFYSLEMPTGYGKTVTSLKVASWLGQHYGYTKVIYVAPYLSILEQNSKVIEDTLQVHPLEHHSLAFNVKSESEDDETSLPPYHLAVEAWAHSVVCTSFPQLFRAVFPSRAQETLRRTYLAKSIIIIDEPQIVSVESWNVFLMGLEAMAKELDLRIIFLSATMPPFEHGLTATPERLSVATAPRSARYEIVMRPDMDQESLAACMVSQAQMHQAAILNTIADAYLVYEALAKRGVKAHLLHGLMAPLHKRALIRHIEQRLKKDNGDVVTVVSTQVLEAGVDLSFRHVARALPVMPAIVQAAGRVNRHFSQRQPGTLAVFRFLRDGNKDTRSYIYGKLAIQVTDCFLAQGTKWTEAEAIDLVKRYYHELFARNSYEANKKTIVSAYENDWGALAKTVPFAETDFYRLPIFVPWDATGDLRACLPERFCLLRERLGLRSSAEVYDAYENRQHLNAMTFDERKQFMMLFNHYVVNVPAKLALCLVGQAVYMQQRVPMLANRHDYDDENGLAEAYVKGYDNII